MLFAIINYHNYNVIHKYYLQSLYYYNKTPANEQACALFG